MNKALAKALQLGFAIGGMITASTLIGVWLDQKFSIAPILTIVGLLLGVASALKYLVDWTKEA